jgi:rhamnosyl/mannosyltransferase
VYYKGVEVLLQALSPPGPRLRIVGEGPRRSALEARALELGLGERVRFLGNCSEEELDRLYRGCRALVLPSVAASETFGLVQLEAMARARPVIAARASGGVVSIHRENETALLVAPGDVRSLRDALDSLWRDPERAAKMGRAAREHVALHFDAGRAVDACAALLEESGT